MTSCGCEPLTDAVPARGKREERILLTRYVWVDNVRGAIILLMVAGHVERAVVSVGAGTGVLTVFDMVLYSFHMPVMFFLSGFLVRDPGKRYSTAECGERVLKSVVKLYVPYLFAVYAYWGVKMLFHAGNEPVSWHDVLTLWIMPRWNLWFLCALTLIEVIVAVFRRFSDRYALLLTMFLCYALWFVIAGTGLDSDKPYSWCAYGVFYVLGMIVRRYECDWKSRVVVLAALVLLGVAMVLLVLSVNPVGRVLCAGAAVSLLCFAGRSVLERRMRVLGLLGRYTLEIYLCHFIGVSVLVEACLASGMDDAYVIWMVCTLLCTLLPLLVVAAYIRVRPLAFLRYVFHPYSLLRSRRG
ncbi:hypothetical protein COO72_01520 [Bifidobacterium callitrichos]|nr:hypothetical protein COO72_01520 [Bifidobacterium callitrichos]